MFMRANGSGRYLRIAQTLLCRRAGLHYSNEPHGCQPGCASSRTSPCGYDANSGCDPKAERFINDERRTHAGVTRDPWALELREMRLIRLALMLSAAVFSAEASPQPLGRPLASSVDREPRPNRGQGQGRQGGSPPAAPRPRREILLIERRKDRRGPPCQGPRCPAPAAEASHFQRLREPSVGSLRRPGDAVDGGKDRGLHSDHLGRCVCP